MGVKTLGEARRWGNGLLIANGVFPKAPLPQRIFAIAMALDRYAGGDKAMREMRLDSPPAAGEIGIAGWQRPDGVQVVRQDRNGVDRERTPGRAGAAAAPDASASRRG